MRLHRSGGRRRGHRAACSCAVTRCPGRLWAKEDGVDLQLRGKRAIVTGGSRGIGLAVAHRLAEEGAEVALVARDPARLAEAAEAVRAHGTEVVVRPTDTTDDAAVRAMVDDVVGALGGVDVLVNAA